MSFLYYYFNIMNLIVCVLFFFSFRTVYKSHLPSIKKMGIKTSNRISKVRTGYHDSKFEEKSICCNGKK